MDYYSYKKIYTYGDMFTLSGEDFEGFIQYKNGEVTSFDTETLLEPKATYDTDLFTSKYFRDRDVNDINIQLPRAKNECLFGLNETFNYEIFKRKLEYLRENNTYFYSRLFIASNNLPFTDEITYAGLSTNNAEQFSSYKVDRDIPIIFKTTSFNNSILYSDLGQVFGTAVQLNYNDPDKFTLFNVTDTSFISITGNDTEFNIVEISNFYESLTSGPVNERAAVNEVLENSSANNIELERVFLPGRENDLQFKKIGGLACNKSHMFITDSGNNTILKYDIQGYLNDDRSIQNRRLLEKILGGSGNTDRRSNFNNPTEIACNDKYVAVYDAGNACIKVYTVEFEYVTTLTLFNIKKQKEGIEEVKSLGFDPDFGTLYVMTVTNTRNIVLYRINLANRDVDVEQLNEVLDEGEELKCIDFSKTDSNFWYFCTSRNLYKKYKTNLTRTVGYYNETRLFDLTKRNGVDGLIVWEDQYTQWENTNFAWNTEALSDANIVTEQAPLSAQKFRGAYMTVGDDGQDKVFIFNEARIYHFNEPSSTSYRRVINKFNYENFGVNGFSLSPKEYVQVPVINGELYKIVNDIITLKNNIIGRFAGRYENDVILLDSYNYNIDLTQFNVNSIESYYIHHNEENTIGALNRVIGQIYDLQLNLIESIQVDSGDLVQSETQQAYRSIDNEGCARPSVPPGKLVIEKVETSNQPLYAQGDIVTYTISLSNVGGRRLENVHVTDTFATTSPALSIIQDDKSLMTSQSGADLNPGESVDIIYDYKVSIDEAAKGRMTNRATARSNKTGSVESDEITVSTILEVSALDVSFNVKDKKQGGYYAFEDEIIFTVDVTNTGNIPMSGAVLIDDFCGYPPEAFKNDPSVQFQLLPGEKTTSPLTFKAMVSADAAASPGDDLYIGNRTCTVSVSSETEDGATGAFVSNAINYQVLGCNAGMDVCFITDFTGSMRDIIDDVKTNITSIIDSIEEQQPDGKDNYRLSLVATTEIYSDNYNNPFSHISYTSLPEEQKLKYRTPYRGDAFLHIVWEPFVIGRINSDSADSFKAQLENLNTNVSPRYGRIGIPGDEAIIQALSGSIGEWRNDVSKYIVFLTDTFLGVNVYFRDENVDNLITLRSLAKEKGIKIITVVNADSDITKYKQNLSAGKINELPNSDSINLTDPETIWKWISTETGGVYTTDATSDGVIAALVGSCTLPQMNI
jgi:uncharacterized repeat protein (TIGR01451 family)